MLVIKEEDAEKIRQAQLWYEVQRPGHLPKMREFARNNNGAKDARRDVDASTLELSPAGSPRGCRADGPSGSARQNTYKALDRGR